MSLAPIRRQNPTKPVDLVRDDLSEALARALSGLRFGSVEIVVHDGRIAHIERRERVRLGETDDRSPDLRKRTDPSHDRTRRTAGGADSTADDEERSE